MKREDLQNYDIPDTPGVYKFLGVRKKLLYIGKATSLQSRVRSYFSQDLIKTRGPLLVKMLDEARNIEWIETDSVLEALLLENRLIKEKQPPYNTKEKDDKSYNHIIITDEQFPRVLLVRERDLLKNGIAKFGSITHTFGPFPQGSKLKEALKIVRKIFPYRDTCTPGIQGVSDPCFNRQIGLCPGVCSGDISARAYALRIRHIALFLAGDKPQLQKTLMHDMTTASKKQDFETAARLRNQLRALEHINDVAIMSAGTQTHKTKERIEAYDVAHISETARVGVMVVVQNGVPQKDAYRLFNIKTKARGDIAALSELLERRFKHTEWTIPDMVVIRPHGSFFSVDGS